MIKGIRISRKPTNVTQERIESRILSRKGHGIAEGANKIIDLTQQELKLLNRIQEYLLWAGRYPLPLKSSILLNSENQELRSFRSNDPLLVDKIFKKLTTVLENEKMEANKS